jgi:hypothetical protein
MAELPTPADPTLEAVDRALEALGRSRPPRPHLGMSKAGKECPRATWYGFRWATAPDFDAATLKRFEDGHRGEDLMAERLRLVDGLMLVTHDPDSGRQWSFSDHGGHFQGSIDGAVLGLIQAPKTWHLWEHKQVGEKALDELEKLKRTYGEKAALKRWRSVYYAQAVLYMHYAGLDRHYLTAASPGGRRVVSVRTEADETEAQRLIAQAKRIIDAQHPPEKISERPDWWQCRMCDHWSVCHGGQLPQANCRTCLHATPVENGWHCARWDAPLSVEEQRQGCPAHLYIPSLVPGEQEDAGGDWVSYRMPDGSIWTDGVT